MLVSVCTPTFNRRPFIPSILKCFQHQDYKGAIEWIIHYTIDYFKMNVGLWYNLKPNNSEQFWWLLGFDQLLHYLTYIFIVYMTLTLI